MTDKRLPELDPVSTPVVTDINLVRQAADTEDRRQTRAQARQLLSGEQYDGTDAASGALLNEAASATNPTLVPNKANLADGIGSPAARSVSSIANSVEGERFTELSGEILQKVKLVQGITAFAGGGQTNATLLTSSYNLVETVATLGDSLKLPEVFEVGTIVRVKMLFGGPLPADIFPFEGDNLGQGVDQPIQLNIHRSLVFIGLVANSTWDTLYADNSVSAQSIVSSANQGPAVPDATSSIANVAFQPNDSDPDTGFTKGGGIEIDTAAVVAGGVAAVQYRELNSGVIQSVDAQFGITAFAGGGQGSAVPIVSSYAEITTAATAGDSVALPATYLVNSLVMIRNSGAEAVDVFPASGDDLGQGVNTAESLPAGDSITYIGVAQSQDWRVFERATAVPTTLIASNAAGPSVLDEAASLTNPTLVPNKADDDTGVGSTDDVLALIAGGFTGLALAELDSGVLQRPSADLAITAFSGGGQGSATALTQSYNVVTVVAGFNDSVRLPAVFGINTLVYVKHGAGGVNKLQVFPASGDDLGAGVDTARDLLPGVSLSFIATAANSTWQELVAGGAPTELLANQNNGPAILDLGPSLSVPNLIPMKSDLNTGIGSAFDHLAMIAGGVSGLELREQGGGIVQVVASSISIVAFAGGGQGSAFPIINSYNVLNTVASAGDSVRMPSAFGVNSLISIKNNGVESADIFPASGDSLGAGTDTAVPLPSGESVTYICNVTNSSWTQLIVTSGGGVPTSLVGANANGPEIRDFNATSLVPNLLIDKTDQNTGIGSGGADQLAFICGGDPSMELSRANNESQVSHTVEGFIVANAGGGQGGAFVLDSSYSNVITVATGGDSVRLPSTFRRGTVMVVANSAAANAMDVFPASGDDLGAGTDTAISVAAGGAAMFFATVASVSWRQIKG